MFIENIHKIKSRRVFYLVHETFGISKCSLIEFRCSLNSIIRCLWDFSALVKIVSSIRFSLRFSNSTSAAVLVILGSFGCLTPSGTSTSAAISSLCRSLREFLFFLDFLNNVLIINCLLLYLTISFQLQRSFYYCTVFRHSWLHKVGTDRWHTINLSKDKKNNFIFVV